MLWLKGWLETRWRLMFVILYSVFPVVLRLAGPIRRNPSAPPPNVESFLAYFGVLWIFASAILAGTGIRTQSGSVQPLRGFHGSSYFTLSLPVSRLSLLAHRTAVGILEMIGVTIVVCCIWRIAVPEFRPTLVAAVEYILVILACSSVFYFLSVLMATFFDDVWQVWGTLLLTAPFGLLSLRGLLPSSIDVFRAMGPSSPLITTTIPWTVVGTSLALSAIFFFTALKIITTREY